MEKTDCQSKKLPIRSRLVVVVGVVGVPITIGLSDRTTVQLVSHLVEGAWQSDAFFSLHITLVVLSYSAARVEYIRKAASSIVLAS